MPIVIPGYEIDARAVPAESEGALATRLSDGRRVLLWPLPTPNLPGARARYRYEVERRANVEHPSVARILGFEETESIAVVVWEAHDLQLLAETNVQAVPLPQRLKAAIDLASGLAALHDNGLVHRALSSRGVLVNAELSKAQWVGFGTQEANPLTQRGTRRTNAQHLLFCTAPEQLLVSASGFDWRSDLYSLGVVLYELFAGHPPLTGSDVLELVHAHLALQPAPLREFDATVPESLSEILQRLLAKEPGARYQSAKGLESDLRRCLADVEANQASNFRPGSQDWPPRLVFSGALFGRTRSRASLESSYAGVCQSAELHVHLLSGAAGVGKTALAKELETHVLRSGGRFIGSKLGQFGEGAPAAALTKMFAAVVPQLLMLPDAELEAFRESFARQMGALSPVISAIVPELSILVGTHPPPPAVTPTESQARLALTIERFVHVIASKAHPLVLFLDDLQWADDVSLGVLERLTDSAGTLHCLIVLSYRDAEIEQGHPVWQSLQRIRERTAHCHEDHLDALTAEDVTGLLAATLARSPREVDELAALVHARTGGVPLLVQTYLGSLQKSGNLWIDPASGWTWEMEGIVARQRELDPVALVSARVKDLPEKTQEILRWASLLGFEFSTSLVAELCGLGEAALPQHLEPAISAGLIAARGATASFTHDRHQEAAKASIPADQIAARKASAGRAVLERAGPHPDGEFLHSAVTLLNAGASTLTAEERLRLAALDIQAAQNAKSRGGYAHGVTLTRTAIDLLPANPWDEHYSLAFSVHREHCELQSLAGDFAGAEACVSNLAAHSRSDLDRAKAQSLLITQYNTTARYAEAIATARRGLALLGLDFPAMDEDGERLAVEMKAITGLVGNRPIHEFLSLPASRDSGKRLAVELLGLATPAFFIAQPAMLPLTVAVMTRLSLESGNVAYSAYAYAFYGFLLAAMQSKHEEGLRWAELGMQLADALDDPIQRCRTTHLTAFFQHYVHPYHDADALNTRGFQLGAENGDLEFAGYHAHSRSARLFVDATPLQSAIAEMEKYREFTLSAQHTIATSIIDAVLGGSRWLAGADEGFLDDEARVERWTEDKSLFAVFVHRTVQAYALLLVERYADALESTRLARQYLAFVPNAVLGPVRDFVEAICLCRRAAASDNAEGDLADAAALRDGLRQLERQCPDNYAAKAELIEAELMLQREGIWRAAPVYERAAQLAVRYGLVADEAIAHLLLASAWQGADRAGYAREHWSAAREAFHRWGASRIAAQLGAGWSPVARRPQSIAPLNAQLDAITVAKTARAVSGEVAPSGVVDALMYAAIENAGATRGALVLAEEEELAVVAVRTVGTSTQQLDEPVPLESAKALLPVGLVQLALRTEQSVVIDDARDESALLADPYVASHDVRSAVMLPFSHHGKLAGVLYLENALVPKAFTSRRLELIQLLAAQAAVSLANARLYDALARSEGRWRALVDSAPDHIAIVGKDGRVRFINRVLEGYRAEDVIGTLADAYVLPEYRNLFRTKLDEVVVTGARVTFENAGQDPSGTVRWYLSRLSPLVREGRIDGVVVIATDVTEAKRAEEQREQLERQLYQAQRLESVGQLAGGVAHDFNNVLMALVGNLSLAQMTLEPSNEREAAALEYLEEAESICQRAADITKQLLTISRRQAASSERFDPGERLRGFERMLRRLVPEDIELDIQACSSCWQVEMDPGHFDQVLLNLVANARDASLPGGSIRVRLDCHTLDANDTALLLGARPGPWVILEVADAGTGIAPDIVDQIFDPFFTSKPMGKGTGLGLATVHAIVKRADGHVAVDSEVDKGTTFRVFLPGKPKAETELRTGTAASDAAEPVGHHTVLLCEDEEMIRRVFVRLLESAGYEVLSASNGREGLEVAAAHEGPIDALVTDVVMPELSGVALARELSAKHPNLKVLFMSGYPAGVDGESFGLFDKDNCLPKPFGLPVLLERLEMLLAPTDPARETSRST